MAEHILVVDDEEHMLALCESVLRKEGYTITCAASGKDALALFAAQEFDLVISDLMLPDIDGVELLHRVKAESPGLPYLLLTAYGSVRSAVRAMKEGATDYLAKPVDMDELKVVVQKALELRRLTREVEQLRARVVEDHKFPRIIGRSKPMRALLSRVVLVAGSDSTVLLQGESGTGKELIAQAVHEHSARRTGPFVTVDCVTVSESLLESELFGYVKGAFTGAATNKKGLCEEAQGGTLFLDEIGDITPAFQAKLLRLLQEGEIRPVGGTRRVNVDVRVIAATNKDLKALVAARQFREDLYYRLAVVPLVLPALRDRREDIPLLVEHFLKACSERHRVMAKTMSPRAMRVLLETAWPGNVRELEHAIERALLLSPGQVIEPENLSLDPGAGAAAAPTPQAIEQARTLLDDVERDKLRTALEKAGHNRAHAAKLLGISRSTLYEKLKRYHFNA